MIIDEQTETTIKEAQSRFPNSVTFRFNNSIGFSLIQNLMAQGCGLQFMVQGTGDEFGHGVAVLWVPDKLLGGSLYEAALKIDTEMAK
jgi:hypothetical protein